MLGIDIGTTSIKIAEIGKDRQLLNYGILETAGYLERFNVAIQTSTLNILEKEVVNYLKILLRRGKFNGREAVVSLPSFSVFTTLVEMPAMSETDTVKAMGMHVKQYVPIPISSVTLDWVKVGERADGEGNRKQQIFLIAVPTKQIDNYKQIFKEGGLKLAALEIEGLSLARLISEKKPVLLVDIGARSTAIHIMEGGFLKFTGQSDFAGASLTQSLATGLNIATRRAEELKKQKGLSAMDLSSGGGAERELSTQLLPILDVIINEARRVKENYEISYRDSIVAVVLSGGGANLLGMEKYFSQQIGLPTSKLDPLAFIGYPERIEPIKKELGPMMGVAIGLALRN